MVPDPPDSNDVDTILAAILQQTEAGQPLDPAAWVARYPRWSQEIRTFCADLMQFGRMLGFTPRAHPDLTTPFVVPSAPIPPVPPDVPAPTLSRLGEYELLEELGRGGMGVVYRARRVGTNLEVALKAFDPASLAGPEALQRLRAEVNSACRLEHPNIVPIYHYGEDSGRPFFTMKRIDGRSLADELPRYHADIGETVRLLIKVARAVHHAHQRQILHRDLKPSNILLDSQGEPLVADFGLAVPLHAQDQGPGVSVTHEVERGGSLPWMAPETLAGNRELTTAVDVWALGVILYEILAGRRPFDGSARELEQKILIDDPPSPSTPGRRIDRDLEAICRKCLAKDQSRRYGSAEALADDLERWQAGQIPRARGRVGSRERLARWCRSHLTLVASGLIGVSFLILVAFSALVALRRQEQRLVREVIEGNEFAAVHVASTLLWRLERLAEAVEATADSTELRRLMAKDDTDGLRAFLERARRTHNQALGPRVLPAGGSGPLASMILLSPRATWIAESPLNPRVKRKQMVYLGREYFRVAMSRGRATGRARVHVSRIFQSTSDNLHKLALAIPVKGGIAPDAPITGVLIVTIAADSTFGLGHLHDERRRAVLFAPRDPSPHDAPLPDVDQRPPEYLVLLHQAYGPGEVPIPVSRPLPITPRRTTDSELDLPRVDTLGLTDAAYHDPVASRYPEYEGRWLAGFAPVGNTELVVGVQQRFDQAVAPHQSFLYRLLAWGSAGILGMVALLVIVSRLNRGSRGPGRT